MKYIFTLKLRKWEHWQFSLSPSFYAIVSGALIGAAINLLTGLVFEPKKANNELLLSIVLIFLSSICFSFLSIFLEQLHEVKRGKDEATAKHDFDKELHAKRHILRRLSIVGFFSIIAVIFIIIIKIRS